MVYRRSGTWRAWFQHAPAAIGKWMDEHRDKTVSSHQCDTAFIITCRTTSACQSLWERTKKTPIVTDSGCSLSQSSVKGFLESAPKAVYGFWRRALNDQKATTTSGAEVDMPLFTIWPRGLQQPHWETRHKTSGRVLSQGILTHHGIECRIVSELRIGSKTYAAEDVIARAQHEQRRFNDILSIKWVSTNEELATIFLDEMPV